MKRLLCLLLSLSALFCLACCSNELHAVPNESTAEAIEGSDFAVAYPAPGGTDIDLPDTIPQSVIKKLEKMVNDAVFTNAFYYKDLATGLTITYNADRYFAAASLQKSTYLYFVFKMIDEGKIALTDEHILLKEQKYPGSGSLRNKPDGTVLTLKEIIEYMISISDNTAYKMLYYSSDQQVMSLSSYHNNSKKEFGMRAMNNDGTLMILNANGTGDIFSEIYYRSLESENFAWYVDIMKNANQNVYIKGGIEDAGASYEVAHKYGMDYRVCDDAGIVLYKDRPYVLVLLADFLGDENYPTDFMRHVSEEIFYIHEYITSPDKWE